MTANKILFCFLLILFTFQLSAQTKKADKIQFNVQETMHYSRYSSDLKYKLNFFINDEFVPAPYDEKFFQKHFKSSKKALNLSLDYLDLDKKANKTKTKGIVFSSLLGLAGLGSVFYLKDESKTTRYVVAGAGLASALTTSYIFTKKHHKQKADGYLMLENAVMAYQAENPSAYEKNQVDSDDNATDDSSTENKTTSTETEMYSVNLDRDRRVSIVSENLRKVAFKGLNINLLDIQFSKTRKQYSPGLGFLYMKNGFFFNANFKLHVYDTNRLFTKKNYEFDNSPFGFPSDHDAYPINLSLPFHASVKSVVPLKSFVKDGPVMTKMKTYGNTTLMYESKTAILHTIGLQMGAEMDKSVQTAGSDFDSNNAFAPSTNNLDIAIGGPIFFRRTMNVSAGISYTLFTAYELKPNEKGLDKSYKVVNWGRFYLVGKYNLNSDFDDMFYNGETPVLFNNIEETKMGFALGLEGAYLNKNRGINFTLEFGSNPHISSGNYKDLYGSLKLGFALGWF